MSGISPTTEALNKFKESQRQGWAHFAPLEALTTTTAAQLVKFARVRTGQGVLDAACGPRSRCVVSVVLCLCVKERVCASPGAGV